MRMATQTSEDQRQWGFRVVVVLLLGWVATGMWVRAKRRADAKAKVVQRQREMERLEKRLSKPVGVVMSASTPTRSRPEKAVRRVVSEPPPSSTIVVEKVDENDPLKEYKLVDRAALRLNCFANVPGLDFRRDVYAKLAPAERSLYDTFSGIVDAEMETMVADGTIDTSRFYQLPDDFTKLRFLQADKWKPGPAMRRLKGAVTFRQQSGLDDFISNLNYRVLDRYAIVRARRFVAFDADGRPIIFERMGEFLGTDDLLKGMSEHDFLMASGFSLCYVLAKCREAMVRGLAKHGYAHRFMYVGDLSGVRYARALINLQAMYRISSFMGAYFPELAGNILIINAPFGVARVWQTIKHNFDPATAARVEFVNGPGKAEILAKCGSPHVVPVEFGGSLPFDLAHIPRRMDEELERRYPYP